MSAKFALGFFAMSLLFFSGLANAQLTGTGCAAGQIKVAKRFGSGDACAPICSGGNKLYSDGTTYKCLDPNAKTGDTSPLTFQQKSSSTILLINPTLLLDLKTNIKNWTGFSTP